MHNIVPIRKIARPKARQIIIGMFVFLSTVEAKTVLEILAQEACNNSVMQEMGIIEKYKLEE